MQPLNLNLNDVDTSMPRLNPGKYAVTIAKAEVVESKAAPGNYNLKVDFRTNDPAPSDKGETLNPGFPLTRYYPIPPYKTREHDDNFKRELAKLQLAVCGLQNTQDNVAKLPAFDDAFLTDMVGKVVIASVRTSKPREDDAGGEDFGPRSEISTVSAP